MNYIDEIFEKVSIRGIADYLLYGLAPDKETDAYESRIDKAYSKYDAAVAKYDKDATSDLLDAASAISSEIESVYTEIGLQAGILFMKDMIQNLGESNSETKLQIDYQTRYLILHHSVTHALELLKSSNEEDVTKAYKILQNGQCRSEIIHMHKTK